MNKNTVGIIILLFLCVGCKKDENIESPQEIGKKIFAYTTDKGSRTYFEEQGNYMVHKWQTDDCIGVFDKTTAVSEYLLIDGADSEEGVFLQMTMPEGGNSLNQAYAIYPLAENNKITAEGVFRVVYPDTQTYSSEHTASYGNGSNILVAASASSESFSFKNACGFLEVQLCGEGITVKNIVLSGNKSERIAGDAVVAYKGATDPKTTMLSTAKTSITLDCGDGVQLDGSLPTSFVFALPPTNFSEGFLIRVTDTDGKFFEKRTDKKIDLVRNAVQPMSSIACKMTIPTNQIWYKSSNAITPTNVGTILTNEYDSTKEYWVITLEQSLTTVGDLAFENNTSLQSILLPNSVTKIGNRAFSGCTSLTSVTIPDSVTSIGGYAFRGCTSLTSVTIPDSVTSIGTYAFDDCTSLTSITIHDSVTEIGTYAFSGCTSLMDTYVNITSMAAYATKNITYNISYGNKHLLVDGKEITDLIIPDSVTEIGDYAFRGCTSLTSVTIPNSVTSIGGSAFRRCTSLTSVTIPDSVTEIGTYAFDGCTSLTSVTIPDSVTEIGTYAFSGCTSLTSVTIPDCVTKIGDCAFSGCTSLTSVTIPDSVTEIGDRAFDGCTSLTSVTIPDSVTEIVWGTFSNCTSLTSITIPDSVTSIGTYAFDGCTSLTSVTIPGSVTKIGDCALKGCTSLTSITIPDSVTEIGGSAFRGCTSLTSITIPDSVTKIESNTFYDCTSLTSVTIGNSVTDIGEKAFYGCTSLTSVTTSDSITRIRSFAFDGCTSLMDTFVNITSMAAYATENTMDSIPGNKHLLVDGKEITDLVIPDIVTEIGYHAFENCTSLTSVTIPDSVTEIGYAAFYGCTSLTSVTILDCVTSIGEKAFDGCTSLMDTYVNITSMAAYATKNTMYYIPGNKHLLVDSKEITDLVIPDSVTSIVNDAFNGCTSLTSVTIPESVTEIGCHAFYDCTGELIINSKIVETDYSLDNEWIRGSKFYKITIGKGITKIGDSAFWNCNSLTSITIPDSVTSIGGSAFMFCTSLTSITIPDSVTSIGGSAFYDCTCELIINSKIVETDYSYNYNSDSATNYWLDGSKFYKITIGKGITKIGEYAFYDCTSLTSVTIPDSVTEIGRYAFYDCTSLKVVYCRPTTPPAGDYYIFSKNIGGSNLPIGCMIYVPASDDDSIINSYKHQYPWSNYASYIVEYEFTE